MGEGDEGEVDGVEHQLDRHEDGDEVALDEKADNAEAEQDGAQEQIPGERNFLLRRYALNSLGVRPFSIAWRARATDPRMATRIRTEVTSKGSSSLVKSTALRSAVLVMWSCIRGSRRVPAAAKNDGGDDSQDGHDGRESDGAGGAAAEGALFAAGVEQHDDEGEKHHDGAGVDDDLRGGEELRAEQQVEDGQRRHHHDQREGAVDGMRLQQEINGSRQAECGKDDKQNQVHRSVTFWRVPDMKSGRLRKGQEQTIAPGNPFRL